MRILIVKLSSFGDTLHALPAAAALKAYYGGELHWAVQPGFSPLVRCFKCVDKVIEVPRPSDPAGFASAMRKLRSYGVYDLAVDLQGLLKSAAVLRAAHAKKRIGPSFAREGSRLFYDDVAGKTNKNRHAVDECMDILDFLGIPRPTVPEFPLETDDSLADFKPGTLNLAVAPMSRWKTKNWPVERYEELLERCVSELGAQVRILGGKEDVMAGDMLAAKTGAVSFCGRTSIAQTLGILKNSRLLVCNDSGPMHMAAALRVPCVALFGPTIPDRTGPYGPGNTVVRAGNCPPCRRRSCPRGTMECMDAITPEIVFNAVRDLAGK